MIVKKWNLLIVHTFVLSGSRFIRPSVWHPLTCHGRQPVPFPVHKIQNQICSNHHQVETIEDQDYIAAVKQLVYDAADITNENGQCKYKTLAFR
ncbi:MAG: hypothetical protein II888_03830 [Clostridia bacterium]|nr:hypothetical protein [Clostridia bacterium]